MVSKNFILFFTHNDFPGMKPYVMKCFFKGVSAAPDGDVFDRLATAMEGGNEEAAEQPPQKDIIELANGENAGNFLVENIMMTMLLHWRTPPQLCQQIPYFRGWGIVVSAKERRMCSHNSIFLEFGRRLTVFKIFELLIFKKFI